MPRRGRGWSPNRKPNNDASCPTTSLAQLDHTGIVAMCRGHSLSPAIDQRFQPFYQHVYVVGHEETPLRCLTNRSPRHKMRRADTGVHFLLVMNLPFPPPGSLRYHPIAATCMWREGTFTFGCTPMSLRAQRS